MNNSIIEPWNHTISNFLNTIMNVCQNFIIENMKFSTFHYCKHECFSTFHYSCVLAGNISNGPEPVNVQDIEALSPAAALIE